MPIAPQNAPTSSPTDRRGGAAMGIIIAVVALAAIGFAVWWFVLRDAAGGDTERLAQAYIPAEAQIIGGADPARLLRSEIVTTLARDAGTDLAALEAELSEQAGVSLDDIASLAFGANADAATGGASSVGLIARGHGDNLAKVQAALDLWAAQMGPAVAGGDPPSFEIVGEHIVGGFGALGDRTRAIAKGEASADEGAADEGRDAVRDALDTGAALWVVVRVPEEAGIGAQMKQLPLPGLGDAGEATHAGFSIDASDTLTLRGAVRFDGDAGAVHTALDQGLSMAKLAVRGPEAELIKQLNIDRTGNVLLLSIALSASQVASIREMADGGGLPF